MTNPSVLFVCLGNICRSPTAEAVFRKRASEAGLDFLVESAGTGAWHVGERPDPRAISAGETRGYSFEGQTARQVSSEDFARFEYILAMDSQNLENLRAMSPDNYSGTLALFLNYADNADDKNVPDPYYGGPDGFEHVIDLIEAASDGLIKTLR